MLTLFFLHIASAINPPGVYHFHPEANRFLEVLFPNKTLPSIQTNSFFWGRDIPEAASLFEITRQNKMAVDPADLGRVVCDIGEDNIDSYWHVANFSKARAESFVAHCQSNHLDKLLDNLAYGSWVFSSVLEKSLFQRDVYQIFYIVHGLKLFGSTLNQPYLTKIKAHLKLIFERTLLSDQEYMELVNYRPSVLNNEVFSDKYKSASTKPYLPKPVYSDEHSWNKVPYYDIPPKHFSVYGGRSFINIFIKTPGLSPAEFNKYWWDLFQEFGENLTFNSNVKPLPAMTETLLLRTFGVFLKDGTYADSHLPESVALRIFKHKEQRFDKTTSDFRGTYISISTMTRNKLIRDPVTLGLSTTKMNDPAFIGFFKNAPDRINSYSDALVTVRYNCIGCHSELHYGASTVFTLARRPTTEGYAGKHLFNNWLVKSQKENFFYMQTDAYDALTNQTMAYGE